MSPRTRSYLYLALCILLWAAIPVASKKILVTLDNLQMLFYSTVLSALAIGGVLVAQGKHRLLIRACPAELGQMALLGSLGAYLYYVLLYAAFARTTAVEGFILAYTWPILVSLLAVLLLGEALTGRKVLAVAVSFLGVVVIVTQGRLLSVSFTSLSGDLLALSGALVFALFSVLGKGKRFDPTVAALVYFLTALLLVTPTLLLFSRLEWPPPGIWPWLLLNGLLINGVTYIFWFKALEHGDTFVISNALYLTPFLSLIYVLLLLDEPVRPSAVMGLAIILAGIGLQSWEAWRTRLLGRKKAEGSGQSTLRP